MAENSLRTLLIEKVENYFNDNDWNNYEYDDQYSIFRAGINLRCKLKSTRMMIVCLDGGLLFHFPISIGTDDENEIQVMEFVTRANCGINFGGFQMNVDNNSIDYTMYIPCEEIPNYNLIDRAISTGIHMLNVYGDEMLAVMFGMKSAKDAIEAAEAKTRN